MLDCQPSRGKVNLWFWMLLRSQTTEFVVHVGVAYCIDDQPYLPHATPINAGFTHCLVPLLRGQRRGKGGCAWIEQIQWQGGDATVAEGFEHPGTRLPRKESQHLSQTRRGSCKWLAALAHVIDYAPLLLQLAYQSISQPYSAPFFMFPKKVFSDFHWRLHRVGISGQSWRLVDLYNILLQ